VTLVDFRSFASLERREFQKNNVNNQIHTAMNVMRFLKVNVVDNSMKNRVLYINYDRIESIEACEYGTIIRTQSAKHLINKPINSVLHEIPIEFINVEDIPIS
jgi:hypothetical protein